MTSIGGDVQADDKFEFRLRLSFALYFVLENLSTTASPPHTAMLYRHVSLSLTTILFVAVTPLCLALARMCVQRRCFSERRERQYEVQAGEKQPALPP